MTLKIFIFFLFSLSVTAVRCQDYTEDERLKYIESFRDYEKCQLGFVNGYGDTMQAAQFDLVEHCTDFNRHHGWIVSQGNLKGLISVYGKWIVPCIYEVIKVDRDFPNGIVVHKTNRGPVGLYDWEGNLVIPDNSLSISNYGEYYKVYNHEKKTAIYKNDFSLLIPPVYDYVAVPEFYRDSVVDRNMLFSVGNDTVYGVINAKMEVVMPLNYFWIGPKHLVSNGDTTLFFLTSRREGYTYFYGLLNAHGDVLLEQEFNTIESIQFYYFNERSLVHSPLYFLKINGTVQAYDLLTHKKSKPYLKLNRFGNYLVFERDRGVSGVLDSDFNEIYVQDKVLLSSDGNNYEGSNSRDIYIGPHGQSTPIYWNASFPDSMEWLYQINPGKIRYSENGYPDSIEKQPRFGLYNLKTKTALPKIHSVLWSMNREGTLFFWGVDMKTRDLYYADWQSDPNAKLTVTVYNEKFKRIAKHKLRKVPIYASYGYEEYSRNAVVIYFENRSGEIGGIDAKGDVIVPFELDDLRIRHVETEQNRYVSYFIFEKKGKFGLLDRFGKELIPCIHDSLEVSNGIYFVGQNADVKVCYDTLGNEICTGFDDLFIANGVYTEFQQLNVLNTYFTFENKLHVWEGGAVKRMDSTRYTFKKPIVQIFDRYWLAKDGSILSKGEKSLTNHSGQLYLLNDHQGNYTTYNVQGEKTLDLNDVLYIDLGNYSVHYRVLFKSGTTGILDRFSGLWVIPPGNYLDIYPVVRTSGNYTVKKSIESENWYVIDSAENVIFDTPIDYPFVRAIDFTILRKSDKYGLSNSSFDLVQPIKYDWILRDGADCFMLQNGQWNVYSKTHGLMVPTFDEIALPKLKEGYLVFKDDSVAYIDFSGKFIYPYVDSKTFVSMHKVTDFIDLPPYVSDSRYYGWGILTDEAPSPLYDRVSMENVLNFLRQKTTKNTSLVYQDQVRAKFHSHPSASMYNFNETSTELTIHNFLVTQNHYSCMQNYWFQPSYDPAKDTTLVEKIDVSYLNYSVEGDSLVQIQLEDLFVKSPSFKTDFEAFLIQTINQQQALPEACVEIFSIVDEMMDRFLLTKTGIRFYHKLLKYQEILVSYESLAAKFKLIRPI